LWGELKLAQDKDFMNVSIIEGDGEIDGIKVSKGDHFILPHGYGEFKLKGDMELIISYI